MAYEIQLKLMVGKVKHLTPYQFNVSACTYAQTRTQTKKGGSSFSARLHVRDLHSTLGKETAPSYSNLNNIQIF